MEVYFSDDQNDFLFSTPEKADMIIKRYTAIASGAGSLPIPFLDFLILGGIQYQMIKELAKVYGVDFKESQGKAIISVVLASSVSRIGGSTIRRIPYVGNVLAGLSSGLMSGATTYGLGQVFKRQFESGGTLLDFDFNKMKGLFNEKTLQFKRQATEFSGKTKDKARNIKQKVGEFKDLASDKIKESASALKHRFEHTKKEVSEEVEELSDEAKKDLDSLLN